VSPVSAVGANAQVATAPPGGPGTAGPALVPEGAPLSAGGIDDALGLLYMAMAQQRQNGVQTSQSRVKSAEKAEEKALADQQAAVKKEEANQADHGRGFFSSIGHLLGDVAKDVTHANPTGLVQDSMTDVKDAASSPAFWNDVEQGALVVAKVAAVVGSAVVTTASFGAGGATIAGAALLLSVGGDVVSDTKCLGDASQGIGLGLQLAGTATGLVGGFASTAMTAVSRTALGVGAAVTGFGGEAGMVAGGAHIENQGFAANVENATADAKQAVNQNAELEQMVAWVIDDLKASDKAHQHAQQSVQGAIQAHDKTTAAAAASISVKG